MPQASNACICFPGLRWIIEGKILRDKKHAVAKACKIPPISNPGLFRKKYADCSFHPRNRSQILARMSLQHELWSPWLSYPSFHGMKLTYIVHDIHVFIYIYIHTVYVWYITMSIYIYIYLYTSICIHMYVCVYIYIYT